MSTVVFPEPDGTGSDAVRELAGWLHRSTSAEAQSARRIINAWYADFPDHDDMVLSRLHGNNDRAILQAIDELHAHDLPSQTCHVQYEEDARSPDFRLYRSADYLAGVEVYTLFPGEGFESEISRNGRLVDELNQRVRPTSWYVAIRTLRWQRQPRVTHVAKWLEAKIASLPPPAANLTYENYPTHTYTSPEAEPTRSGRCCPAHRAVWSSPPAATIWPAWSPRRAPAH